MSTRARFFAALVFAVTSLVAVGNSIAGEARVAVVDAPSSVTKAIAATLSPWGVRVVPVSTAITSRDVTAATAEARSLATREDVGAVVWIASADDERPSLWMYDSETEAVVIRPLTQPRPFDDASAAALALSVKTLLRATAMAPPRERAPAVASSSATTASSAAPSASASATAPAPSVSAAPIASASASASAVPPPVARSRHDDDGRPSWRVEALVTGRAPTGAPAPVAAEGGLALSYWPALFGKRYGVGIDFRWGPSIDVTSATFAGTFADTSFAATARARFDAHPFALELQLRPALHLISLSGTALATSRSASVERGDVSIGAFVVPEIALGRRLAVGAPLGIDTFLRTQLYVLGDAEVLRMPTFAFDFGGRVSVALD